MDLIKKILLISALLIFMASPLLAQSVNYPSVLTIRKLFVDKDFNKLTATLASYQHNYEKDIGEEIAFDLALRGFYNPDPAYEKLFKLWLAQNPTPFLPLLARSHYYLAMGWHSRGDGFANKVSKTQFEQQRHYHSKALIDIDKAIAINPNLAILYALKIDIAKGLGDRDLKQSAFEAGMKVNPASYQLRKSQINSLMPRWGGSYEQIAALLADTKQYEQENANLKPLSGFISYTKGLRARERNQFDQGIVFLTAAIEHGEKAWFYKERGHCYYFLKKYDLAIADFNRALALYPEYVEVLSQRSWAYKKKQMLAEALGDIDLAVELEPYTARLYKYRGYLLTDFNLYDEAVDDFTKSVKLDAQDAGAWASLAWNAGFKLKDHQTAINAYKKAIELEPENTRFFYNYAQVLNNMHDCSMKSVLKKYLQLCAQQNCSAKNIKWVNNVANFLANPKVCPN